MTDTAFIVDLNVVRGECVHVSMDFTRDHGPRVRVYSDPTPQVGEWVQIYCPDEHMRWHAQVEAVEGDREIWVRPDWRSGTTDDLNQQWDGLPHQLAADFGDDSDPHLVPAIATEGIWIGETVILADGDGNRCSGTVSRTDGRIAWVQPLWSTWHPAA